MIKIISNGEVRQSIKFIKVPFSSRGRDSASEMRVLGALPSSSWHPASLHCSAPPPCRAPHLPLTRQSKLGEGTSSSHLEKGDHRTFPPSNSDNPRHHHVVGKLNPPHREAGIWPLLLQSPETLAQ